MISNLVCWGNGKFGQNFHPNMANTSFDFALNKIKQKDIHDEVISVTCGASHTVILTKNFEAYAWGNGQNGQLGNGSKDQKTEPIKMSVKRPCSCANKLHRQAKIVQVACGDRHTCLLASCGCVWVCGSNFYAQNCYDHMETKYKEDVTIPRFVFMNEPIKAVACGQHHTALLSRSGCLYCYGRNMYGQVGAICESTKYDEISVPRLTTNLINSKFKSVSAGSNHTMAIDEYNDVYVWGYGVACGYKRGNIMMPMKVRGFSKNVKKVVGGSLHTLFLTENNEIWCVGDNYSLQCLPNGVKQFISIPMQIPSELFDNEVFQDLDCGENYSACVTAEGNLYVWGKNSHVIRTNRPVGEIFGNRPISLYKTSTDSLNADWRINAISCGTWHMAALIKVQSPVNESASEAIPERQKQDDSIVCHSDDEIIGNENEQNENGIGSKLTQQALLKGKQKIVVNYNLRKIPNNVCKKLNNEEEISRKMSNNIKNNKQSFLKENIIPNVSGGEYSDQRPVFLCERKRTFTSLFDLYEAQDLENESTQKFPLAAGSSCRSSSSFTASSTLPRAELSVEKKHLKVDENQNIKSPNFLLHPDDALTTKRRSSDLSEDSKDENRFTETLPMIAMSKNKLIDTNFNKTNQFRNIINSQFPLKKVKSSTLQNNVCEQPTKIKALHLSTKICSTSNQSKSLHSLKSPTKITLELNHQPSKFHSLTQTKQCSFQTHFPHQFQLNHQVFQNYDSHHFTQPPFHPPCQSPLPTSQKHQIYSLSMLRNCRMRKDMNLNTNLHFSQFNRSKTLLN